MHDFWNQVFFSNPLKKYVGVVITILLALTLKRLLSRYIAGLLFRVVKKVSSGIDKTSFVNLVAAPLSIFLFVVISFAAVEKLHFPSEIDFDIFEVPAKTIVHSVAIAIIILGFIWLLLRIIDFISMILARKANETGDVKDNQLIVFFRDFFKVIITIIGVLMTLAFAFNVEVSKLTAGLGLAGAALALAAKESVENLIASFIIFFDKPFTAGDVVKVQGISGNIEKIGLRSTRIRTDVKTYVTVPNKQMVDSIVDNLTLRTQRKAEIRLPLGLSVPPETMTEFINGIKSILKKEVIINSSVFLNDITSAAYLINIDYFTSPIPLDDFNNLKEQVNIGIMQLMEKHNIQIAGASTDINVITKSNEEKN
ncbi:MAG TPA: mechanosensitive ion channel domain-containing protein [Puia sp.]|nr:mechanosensitive ion channel domain-containing protein [Puia sp.]